MMNRQIRLIDIIGLRILIQNRTQIYQKMKENQQETYLFSNPVCKQTYQSLPKIYGGKAKQKTTSRLKLNASNAAITKHNCLFHVEQIQKKSPLSRNYMHAKSKYLSLPKAQKCNKKNCLCSKPHEQDMKTMRKAHSGFAGNKKIKLRPLPVIAKPDDFESEHKVAMKINTQPRMPSGLAMIVHSQRHLAILAQSNPRNQDIKEQSFINQILNQQEFYHTETKRKRDEQQVLRSKTQQIAIGTNETPILETPHISFEQSNISRASAPAPQQICVEVQVNLDDAIEKRSQQDSYRMNTNAETGVGTQTGNQNQNKNQNQNQSSIRQKLENNKFKKLSRARKSKFYASEEDEDHQNDESDEIGNKQEQNLQNSRNSSSSLALSSVLVKGLNSKTTQFKKLRQKQQKQNLKQSRVKSTKSNGTFRIPTPQDYLSYLKSYRVLDKKNFNLKQLVKKPLFSIIEEEEGVYFGEYQNQQKNGTGINVTEKLIFEGVYQSGKKIKGCERNIDGVYKGYFVNGKRDGYGTFQWNNGEKFQGNWKDGVKSGFGVWRSPKGDTYQGEWSNNRQHGQGVFKHKNSTYKGQYENFLKHGKGQQSFINGDSYSGDYKLGKPDGFGKYVWYEGGLYQGQFKNGIRSGYGKLIQSNGSVYEGQFYEDYKHGQGKQVYKSGDYFEGVFVKGSISKGMLYKKQGKPQYIDNS